jgi:hypothetical protein
VTYRRALALLLGAGLSWDEAHQIAAAVSEEEK